jgi:hypothetical protein
MIGTFGKILLRTKPSAALPQTRPRGSFSSVGGDFSYNLLHGHCGLVRCDDHAKRFRNSPRGATDGNKTAAPQGQRSTFARLCAERSRYAPRYRRGDRGGNSDPDRDSPTRSSRLAKSKSEQRKPATRWVIRRKAQPVEANPADQRPADRFDLNQSLLGTCGTKTDRGPNDPIWPGSALRLSASIPCNWPSHRKAAK